MNVSISNKHFGLVDNVVVLLIERQNTQSPLVQLENGDYMNEQKGVTVDFEQQYNRVDKLVQDIAKSCLEKVSKNDVRILIKVGNRLETALQDIKDVD